jgi:hypothetical protein
MNKKVTFKKKKGLWLSPIEDDRFWILLAWLVSRWEVREALLISEPPMLPVIRY